MPGELVGLHLALAGFADHISKVVGRRLNGLDLDPLNIPKQSPAWRRQSALERRHGDHDSPTRFLALPVDRSKITGHVMGSSSPR
jgi:hypothetical protein